MPSDGTTESHAEAQHEDTERRRALFDMSKVCK